MGKWLQGIWLFAEVRTAGVVGLGGSIQERRVICIKLEVPFRHPSRIVQRVQHRNMEF